MIFDSTGTSEGVAGRVWPEGVVRRRARRIAGEPRKEKQKLKRRFSAVAGSHSHLSSESGAHECLRDVETCGGVDVRLLIGATMKI